jgi:hypothetical protein
VLDRISQNLPIPIGGTRPAHRPRRALFIAWHRYKMQLIVGLALSLVASGAVLVASTPPLAVFADNQGVHIGSTTLREQAGQPSDVQVYAGEAVLVLRRRGASLVAAGVTKLNGHAVSGRCDMSLQAAKQMTETCTFFMPGGHVSHASDVFDPSANEWRRKYSDGRTLRIEVPSGERIIPVPIPFN